MVPPARLHRRPGWCGRAPGSATSRRATGRSHAWRSAVQADHVLELGSERRIGGQLVASHPMRRQAGRLPDLMDLGRLHAARPRHRAHGPLRRLARRPLLQGAPDHLDDLASAARLPLRRSVAQQPVDALLDITLLPAPHRRLAQALRRMISAVSTRSSLSSTTRARQRAFAPSPISDDHCQPHTIRRTHDKPNPRIRRLPDLPPRS